MEQIVKIFVQHSYFIENDLIVDYNVEQGAHVNISQKDWIALIPKGWSGVDEQVAFKTVDISSDIVNLPIKSIVMEKKCFQDVVECDKYYQLMYVSQYLEILGKSEYFVFLHHTSICNCASSIKTKSKGNSRPNRNSTVFSKPIRRQSPTPHDFYKNQQQNNAANSEKSKSKQWLANKCIKCNAPNNFAAVESALHAKIQDLTISNEIKKQSLLTLEDDLTQTLELINKQFKLHKNISQEKNNIEQFIDDIVDGLLNDGKITFWAHDQEFSVIREYPDKIKTSLLSDDFTTFVNNESLNSSKEVQMKAIIGQQEKTIQHLMHKIKDMLGTFLKENEQLTKKNNNISPLSENNIGNMGYMDRSGTTYFSPSPNINDTLNSINVCLSKSIKNNILKLPEKNVFEKELSDIPESKEHLLNKDDKNQMLTFEDQKKEKSDCTKSTKSGFNKKKNGLSTIELNKNNDLE
ncbi:uncharacterized protein LOC112679438 isoform X2 [Sipha flava]|nr:uncharacterized protein LOC112679438 isoform X2 [Sipha flava]XP_025405029.1 uncharacterized protein LOC112679438 isoform X2 [Sipha flava]XP_025405035.1 uncharacterized protein LOC112679438 isoform X2 [Sipha flava]XP_025405045.1 uncharacterized protein LOC112679438 isoform X2 [Sipha flava]